MLPDEVFFVSNVFSNRRQGTGGRDRRQKSIWDRFERLKHSPDAKTAGTILDVNRLGNRFEMEGEKRELPGRRFRKAETSPGF